MFCLVRGLLKSGVENTTCFARADLLGHPIEDVPPRCPHIQKGHHTMNNIILRPVTLCEETLCGGSKRTGDFLIHPF